MEGARRLEAPGDLDQFQSFADDAVAALRRHVEGSRSARDRATGFAPMGEVLARLEVDRWLAEGGMDRAGFRRFLDGYLDHAVRLHHPRYIAHQVSTPDLLSGIDGLVNGVVGNPMAIFEMGPSGAALEWAIVNWMLRKVGWPEQRVGALGGCAGGVLTHGGSLANLTALLAARARVAPDAWEGGAPDDLVVLVAPNAHYSVARSVAILGLGARAVRHLPADRFGVVDAKRLPEAVAAVRAEGKRVMAVVANACGTATGLHDPLRPIGAFCRAEGLWLHADACHGASALLSKRYRPLLDGLALADSIVWDAHKMLQVHPICAAVLLRDGEDFARAFHQDASYLALGAGDERYDSLPRAVECTKSALGLRLFLNLAVRGEAALARHVESRYDLARRCHALIEARPGFSCPFVLETNIVCFRYGTDDALQAAIRDQLMVEGRFHITAAVLGGARYLRLTVSNPLTDEATIMALLDAIEATARALAASTSR